MDEESLFKLARDVIRFFRGRFPPGVTSEDAFQEACLLVLEWRDRFPADNRLVVKARGVLRDKYGKLWKQLYQHGAIAQGSIEETDGVPPDEAAIDVREDVRKAIGLLEPRQRRAIVLHLAGLTQVQIAKRLGVVQPYISQLLKAAREKLRELLSESYE